MMKHSAFSRWWRVLVCAFVSTIFASPAAAEPDPDGSPAYPIAVTATNEIGANFSLVSTKATVWINAGGERALRVTWRLKNGGTTTVDTYAWSMTIDGDTVAGRVTKPMKPGDTRDFEHRLTGVAIDALKPSSTAKIAFSAVPAQPCNLPPFSTIDECKAFNERRDCNTECALKGGFGEAVCYEVSDTSFPPRPHCAGFGSYCACNDSPSISDLADGLLSGLGGHPSFPLLSNPPRIEVQPLKPSDPF
jgi:hypothetical protein